MELSEIVDFENFDICSPEFQASCRNKLDQEGALVLPGFMMAGAVETVRKQSEKDQDKAYYCTQEHNVYISPSDPDFSESHPRNRKVVSSKGCITDDIVPADSPLRALYDSKEFRAFLCAVLGEDALYPYADPLSSINVHYASEGQELGWHFDNSSFATTLMIQEPERGGAFEYVEKVRDADAGEMNFQGVEDVLDGRTPVEKLSMKPGALVLFRGRNAIHRVAPVEGDRTRMLVVLAYNSEPGIELSETSRMAFYGRLN